MLLFLCWYRLKCTLSAEDLWLAAIFRLKSCCVPVLQFGKLGDNPRSANCPILQCHSMSFHSCAATAAFQIHHLSQCPLPLLEVQPFALCYSPGRYTSMQPFRAMPGCLRGADLTLNWSLWSSGGVDLLLRLPALASDGDPISVGCSWSALDCCLAALLDLPPSPSPAELPSKEVHISPAVAAAAAAAVAAAAADLLEDLPAAGVATVCCAGCSGCAALGAGLSGTIGHMTLSDFYHTAFAWLHTYYIYSIQCMHKTLKCMYFSAWTSQSTYGHIPGP